MSKSGKIALIVGGILVLIELLLFLQYLREKETTVFPKAPIPVEYPIVNYNNSVKGHDERESIVWVFDGKDRDSLYVIPADEIGFGEDAILSLTGKCLPKNSIAMTEAEILTALPRWENNGSVQNTRSAVTTEMIRKILIQKYQKT